MSEPSVSASVVEDTGQINLRGDPRNAEFMDAVREVLGQSLPVEPNTVTMSEHRVCWLGPDDWLILTAAGGVSELVNKLESALIGQHAAVNDVSGGQILLNVRGEHVCDLFAKGCALDFHPASFSPGSCAQSGLAKANVLFIRAKIENEFDIIVRRSFSDYLIHWLRRAGRELGTDTGSDSGIEFS